MKHEALTIEVLMAWKVWYNYHDWTYSKAMSEFYKFTGIESFLDQHHIVTEEQLRRIKLMAGPHGHTLLAAHFAREEAR